MKPCLLYIYNGQGLASLISGGDIRFIEIAKRLVENWNIVILSTVGGVKTCERENLKVKFVVAKAHLWKNMESGLSDRIISYMISPIYSIILWKKIPNPDIIYTTSDFSCDIIPACFFKIRNSKQKWVAMVHHRYGKPWKRKGNAIWNWLGYFSQQINFGLIKRYADVVLVYKSHEGKEIQKYFESASKKVFAVENGVDFRLIRNEPEQDKKYEASFVAGLRANKGVFELIKIWKMVCEEQKEARLVIVGSGEKRLENKMKDIIKNLGLTDNIIMLGYVLHDEIFKILKMSKLFISPSFEEGWGIAICEAMACGLPIIAWDLPLYRGTFPKGMMRIPLGDMKEFADTILKLLKNETLYNSISKDALKIVSKYDWDKIAENELELLKKTLKS